jgi:hypothetical protein
LVHNPVEIRIARMSGRSTKKIPINVLKTEKFFRF